MKATAPHTASFGPFTLDPRSGELRKFGVRVKLGEQPLQILLMLLENQGELVTRDELRAKLWPGDTFVDFDHSLNSAVQRLRDTLSDTAEKPVWIETIPRRGYRFIGAVKSESSPPPGSNGAHDPLSTSVATPPTPPVTAPASGSRAKLAILATTIALAIIIALSFSGVRQRLFDRGSPRAIQSLAVLPVVNLSGDTEQEYFADGMTEALITDLGKISALRVISHTSVMQYKGTKKPLPEIAKELNVDALIEGTVSRSGNHLRITTNLVQAAPEKHLWAETYESEVGDALTLQGKIAQTVARQIQVKLTPNEQTLLAAARPVNPEAQDLYWRGVYAFNQGETAASTKRAINYFQQAVEKDPNYAAAYTSLAEAYATWIPGMSRPRDLMPKAKEYVLKALALDDTQPDAHASLGAIELFYNWDWSAADAELKRALQLSPNHAWAHSFHAREMVASGRTEEAVAEAKLVIELSPSPMTWDYPVWIFALAGRNDLALERAKELVDVAPQYVWGHYELARVLAQEGRGAEAAQEFLKTDELFGTDPKEMTQLKDAFAKSGEHGYWKRVLQNYQESAKSSYVPSVLVAEACMRVGDKECAFQWLEKGFDERDDLMINLKVDSVFDAIRSDPRFEDLIRRVGIPQ